MFNAIGQRMPKSIRIRLREDQSGGVCIGGGVDLEPGDEADVPAAIAYQLIGCGRADRVIAEELSPETEPESPVDVQTPDPKVTRRRTRSAE